MILIDAVIPKVVKKLKTYFIFLRTYNIQIKPVLFLFALYLLAATKHYSKETRKIIVIESTDENCAKVGIFHRSLLYR